MVSENRNVFITQNLGLVHSVAKRFKGRGVDYDDLYQAGCVGLIKAADNFDEGRGFAFSTYAVPVIMGEVKRLFRDGGAIKVSRSIKDKSLKVQTFREEFEREHLREPTVSELSELCGLQLDEIIEIIDVLKPVMSLSFIYDGENENVDVPCDNFEKLFDKLIISEATEKLNDTERKIVKLRYYCDKTQSETAQLIGLSQVQVSRREKAILHKLRDYMK